MKTTIDLPEDLLHRAKIVAAQRKTTLRELVQQGLLYAISRSPQDTETERRNALQTILDRMQCSNTTPMQPLNREEIHDR